MKNNRIKISKSQLGRLVENNVNENSGGVGNLSTDDQANIGMGSSNIVTTTHMDRPEGRLNIMGGTNPQQFKEEKMLTDVTCVSSHGECGKAEKCETCADMSMGPEGGEQETCTCEGDGSAAPDGKRKRGTIITVKGDKEISIKESNSMNEEKPGSHYFKKWLKGLFKSNERVQGEEVEVIWPSREEQQKMSGRLDQMGIELPDGWEPGHVCTWCECPPGQYALWINGCPCEEEETIDDWMNEQQSMTYQAYHEPKDRVKEETTADCDDCSSSDDCKDCEGDTCYGGVCMDNDDAPGDEKHGGTTPYDYIPDSETPIDKLEESLRRRLNEYFYTQAEGDSVCAGAGYGPMTSWTCEDDGSGVTETCTVYCSSIVPGGPGGTVETSSALNIDQLHTGNNKGENLPTIRRSDRDKARRNPYSARHRDMRGANKQNRKYERKN